MTTRRQVLATLAGLGGMALTGANPHRLFAAEPGTPKMVFFLLDGCRQDTFARLCDEGKVPTLARLRDGGLWADTGVSVFPSTTGPAYAPFINGLLPATSGLAGIRQLKRAKGQYRVYCGQDSGAIKDDLNPSAKTIFEMLPKEESLSVFGMIDRGAKRTSMPLMKFLWDKLSGNLAAMDVHSMAAFKKLAGKGLPRFSFVTLHTLDSIGHKEGVDGEHYRNALIQADKLIGNWLTEMHKAGHGDDLIVVISADHGLDSTHKNGDLAGALRAQLGLKVQDALGRLSLGFNLKARLKALRGEEKAHTTHDAIVAVSGNACVQIYLRGTGGKAGVTGRFDIRPTLAEIRSYRGLDGRERGAHMATVTGGSIDNTKYYTQGWYRGDIITTLLNEACVGFLVVRDGVNRARVYSRSGESRIDRHGDKLAYRVVTGTDPLNMRAAAPMADGRWLSERQWFAHTAGEQYPDALFQIMQLLDAPDSGDIIINAAPDYEPWTEGQKGVHGGVDRGQLCVPILVWGRGVPAGTRVATARTVDLFPTMLRLLELDVPGTLPGLSLL